VSIFSTVTHPRQDVLTAGRLTVTLLRHAEKKYPKHGLDPSLRVC